MPTHEAIINPNKTHKLSLINIHDYRDYPVYWELINYDASNDDLAKAAGIPVADKPDPWNWAGRIMDKETGEILHAEFGGGQTEDDVRRAGQEWVLSIIEDYAPKGE